MRINTKLLINIFLPIGISLMILLVMASALRARNEADRKNMVALSLLSEMTQLNQRTYYYLLYREERAKKEWLSIYDSLSEQTFHLEFNNPVQDQIVEGIRHNLAEMKTIFTERIISAESGTGGSPGLANERRDRLSSQLLIRARSISADAFRLYEISAAEAHLHGTRSNTVILVLLLASILISLATLIPINRNLSRSISKLTAGAAIVGSGNLDHKIGLATNDEIGLLSAAFDAMTANLKQVTVSRDDLVREIAVRKRVEEALRRSEAILAQAGQMAHLGAWEIEFVTDPDLDANPLRWSDEVFRIFGYEPGSAAVTNALFFERVHPADREIVRQAVARAREEKTSYAVEHRIVRPDGTVRTVYEHGDFVYAGDGKLLRLIGAVQDITDRKRAEAALRISEENYKAIFNSANDAIFIHDITTGEIIDVNETMLALYGYSRDELRTKTVEDLSDAAGGYRQQNALAAIGRAAAGTPQVFEWRARSRNGATFWVEVSLKRVTLGGVDRLLAVVRDIDSRKKREQEFRQVSRQNELILEFAGEGIFGLDLDGKVSFVNSVAAQMLGYERGELMGSHSHSKWHSRKQDGSDYPSRECPIYAAYAEGRIHSGEDFFWRKDGSGFPIEFTSRPLYEDGTIAGAVVMYRDITERKRAEESIQKQANMINLAYDSIFVRNQEGRITFWNRGAVIMYGWREDEAIGQDPHELLRTGFPKPLSEIREELFRTGLWEGELEHSRIDGSRITVESRWALIRDSRGVVREIMEANRDVTARKNAEMELKRLVEELERSNRELEQFAYVASHDLQEPLRMVASYVQLLERRYKDRLDEKADRFIFFAVDGVKRMQKLIDGLLAYSRVARGARFTAVDMNNVFAQVLSNLAVAIRESGAEVLRDDLPVVQGDETQLQQLLQNLIGNAVKYRKPDVSPRVQVSARRSGKEWQFSVKDNGIGIDPKFFERIFLIFQRLHSRDEYPGTGLGLSLCKRIVERHGGRIWLESEPGKGSTFFFAIPEKKTG